MTEEEIYKYVINIINKTFSEDKFPKSNIIYKIKKVKVIFWDLGGFILYKNMIKSFHYCGGKWYLDDNIYFCLGYLPSFVRCLKEIVKFVNNNSKPIYFEGTTIKCDYDLN